MAAAESARWTSCRSTKPRWPPRSSIRACRGADALSCLVSRAGSAEILMPCHARLWVEMTPAAHTFAA
eukprot:SAG25_NODE_95_length_15927_cov_8.666224_21_plen_68_part_00